jgi:hypothetical protein
MRATTSTALRLRRRRLLNALALTLSCVAITAAISAPGASAANTNYLAAVYSNPWSPSTSFVGIIAPYVGVNVYCWTDASTFGDSRGASTNRWFYIRWWNVWHWLYGFTPAMYVNNQPVVGHC